MDIDLYYHFDRMVADGVAEISDRDFHGYRVYLVNTDYLLDNFYSQYVNQYDGLMRDGILETEADLDAMTDTIRREGFRAPIFSGAYPHISDGHARVAAAQRLGISRIPVSIGVIYRIGDEPALLDEPLVSVEVLA